MCKRVPIDLSYCALGYLWSPDGRHLRHIIGLDRIAADALTLGARLYWSATPGDHAGYCYYRSGVILVAPWVWWCGPAMLRRLVSHELAHCVVGPSQVRARAWACRLYGDLVEPAFVQV